MDWQRGLLPLNEIAYLFFVTIEENPWSLLPSHVVKPSDQYPWKVPMMNLQWGTGGGIANTGGCLFTSGYGRKELREREGREGVEKNGEMGVGLGARYMVPQPWSQQTLDGAGVGGGAGARIRGGLRSWSGCLGWDMILWVLFPGMKDGREEGEEEEWEVGQSTGLPDVLRLA